MANLIDKLQRVPLREVWRHEAYDFTQWLQENLDILNDTLDLELTSAEREQAAGRNQEIEDDSEYFSKNLKPGKN